MTIVKTPKIMYEDFTYDPIGQDNVGFVVVVLVVVP